MNIGFLFISWTAVTQTLLLDSNTQEQQDINDKIAKTKRRSKNTGDDRNYSCGCGKNYLSYPALYTHIKTKHDGVSPAGTSQPQSNGKPGRGRPKVHSILTHCFF